MGNRPGLFETESGIAELVGLQNIGVRLCARQAARSAGPSARGFANVFGYSVEDSWRLSGCWKTPRACGLRAECFVAPIPIGAGYFSRMTSASG